MTRLLIVAVVLIGFEGAALGADPAPATQPAEPATPKPSPILPEDFVADDSPYKLGVHDMIRVQILDMVEPNEPIDRQARLSKQGTIQLPTVGPVELAGKTAREAEAAVADVYKRLNLVREGQVQIRITEARGNTYAVLGEVNRSGQYSIPAHPLTLRQALATAGGAPANVNIMILRGTRLLEIPGQRLVAGDDAVNIFVRPKDTIMVRSIDPGQ